MAVSPVVVTDLCQELTYGHHCCVGLPLKEDNLYPFFVSWIPLVVIFYDL